jgi:hypothetical protein
MIKELGVHPLDIFTKELFGYSLALTKALKTED